MRPVPGSRASPCLHICVSDSPTLRLSDSRGRQRLRARIDKRAVTKKPGLWYALLGLAGLNACALALYHSILPYHMGWREGLHGVPGSVVWAVYALNFSWSVLVFLAGALVLYAAWLGPAAGTFARRTIFTVGLFWAIHGIYTWLNPLPLPPSFLVLKYALLGFPALVVALHWLPLLAYRRDPQAEVHAARG